ncbi:MAG: hypothetical protein NUV67_04110 [archaeon]|nr:hypothetical protein [archaeon]
MIHMPKQADPRLRVIAETAEVGDLHISRIVVPLVGHGNKNLITVYRIDRERNRGVLELDFLAKDAARAKGIFAVLKSSSLPEAEKKVAELKAVQQAARPRKKGGILGRILRRHRR